MNGAEAILRTLADCGVMVCFANPGTSEMQMVAAFDREPRVQPVLCLFEGVATGAADGYARMTGKPASTLLHLGPGLSNGSANLHNARRAFSPVINIVGDHATYHCKYDAPLSSDIEALAKPNSVWVGRAETPDEAVTLAGDAWVASQSAPRGPATLILPADCAWSEATGPAQPRSRPALPEVAHDRVDYAASALQAASRPVLLLGSLACTARGLAAAGQIASAGVRVFPDAFVARLPRGRAHFAPIRLAYFGQAALDQLADADLLILAGTKAPVAFFAYPDAPSELTPQGAQVQILTSVTEDSEAALVALAKSIATTASPLPLMQDPPRVDPGRFSPHSIGAMIARHLPEGSVVSDDGTTASGGVFQQTQSAAPHDWLYLTGGAIGQGIPVAVGAATARRDSKVISLNGDGAAAYTVQGLWTAARENLNVTTIIFSNNAYRILDIEFARTRSGNAGRAARSMLDIGNPRIDWCALASGFGIPAIRTASTEAFDRAFVHAMSEPGPHLIEAILE